MNTKKHPHGAAYEARIAALEAEIARLRDALRDAAYCLDAWARGADADDYSMDRADIRAALESD